MQYIGFIRKYYFKSFSLISYFPLLFFFPYQFKQNPFLNPVVWCLWCFSLVLLPLLLMKRKDISQKILILFSIYLLYLFFANVISSSFSFSAGYLLIYTTYFLLFIVAKTFLSLDQKKTFMKVFVITVSLLAVIANLTFAIGYRNIENEGLSFMWFYFGHNHLSVLLICSILWTVYYWGKENKYRRKYLILLLLFFQLMSLWATLSRTSFLALIGAGLIGFLTLYSKKINRTKIVMGSIIVMLGLIVFMPHFYFKGLSAVTDRVQFINRGIDLFIQKPVIGHGWGSYGIKTAESAGKKSYFAHNLIVQVLSEQGLVGLILLATILMSVLYNSFALIQKILHRDNKLFYSMLWVSLIGLLLNEMADFDLQIPATGALFWLIVGMVNNVKDPESL